MKTILNVWMQPVYARLNLHGIRSLVILLLSIPVVVQVLVFVLDFWKDNPASFKIHFIALLISIGGLLALLFYGWFIMLAMNVSLQYSPSNAKLIPGFKRKLQLSLVLPILFVSICATTIFGLVEHKWSFFPFFAVTAFLSFFIVTIRNQWAVIPFVLLFPIPAYFESSGSVNPLKFVEASIGLSIDAQCFLLSILIIVFTQVWLFSVRDEAHFKMYQRAQLIKGGLQAQNCKENNLTLGFAAIYLQMMKNHVNKMLLQGSSVKRTRLAMYVLGPRVHCSTFFLQIISMGVLVLVFLRLMALVTEKKNDFWEGVGQGSGLFIGMYLIAQPVIFLVQMFYRIYQTRSEQALICLAPFSGSRQQIDRELTSYCFRQFGIFYGVSVLSAICFLMQRQTMDLKCAALVLTLTAVFPCILAIPTTYSEMRSMNDHPIAWSALPGGIILAVGLSGFIFMPYASVWIYPLVVIPMTAVFLLRKLRASRERIQFPAGWAV